MHPSRTEKRLPKGTQTESYLEAFEGFGYLANVTSRRFGLHLWGKVVSFFVFRPGVFFDEGVYLLSISLLS